VIGMRWAIAFVTMDRPDVAQRFVRSARRLYPDVPIYVADQSAALAAMREFYEAERVTLVRMPFDAGLSASRDALVEAMDVDYFALCDDDFILGPSSSFEPAIEVLEADPGLGVVGGMLHDLDAAGERIRNWEVFFDHDPRHGRFTVTPIYNYPPLVRRAAGRTLFACDAVLNFAVFRRAICDNGLRWDARIKINGEHEDFYLALKTRSHYGVAYLPAMAALHQPIPRHGRRAALRARSEGRHAFMQKWGVTAHVEIGTGARPLDGAPVEEWFVAGEGTAGVATGIAHSRRYTTLGPVARTEERSRPEYQSFLGWLAPDVPTRPSLVPGRSAFRYQPAVDPDGDLLLWYRPLEATRRAEGPGQSGIVLRWYSPDGDVLVWESHEHAVRAAEDRYWQPIVARIPVWPRGATYLRFDLVCAGGTCAPLAMGFVYPEREVAGGPELQEAPEVLAWARTTPAATGVELPHEPLATLLAGAPRTPFEAVRHGRQPLARLDVSMVDFLGIVSEQAAGPPLWLAAGARGAAGGPGKPGTGNRQPGTGNPQPGTGNPQPGTVNRQLGTGNLLLPLSLLRDPGTVLFAHAAGEAANPLRILDVLVTELPAAPG
jgi:hypothetical protein